MSFATSKRSSARMLYAVFPPKARIDGLHWQCNWWSGSVPPNTKLGITWAWLPPSSKRRSGPLLLHMLDEDTAHFFYGLRFRLG
jgi:hypothetical protein